MLLDPAIPMGAIQRACFLLFLLQAAVLTSADDSSIAASSDRNFPVDVKLVNWPGDSDFNNYVTELAVQTGGVGIGLGIIFTTCMLFHLMCWGMCCNCCRCCCFKEDNLRDKRCFRKDKRIYFLIGAILLTCVGIAGVIIIAVDNSQAYTKVENAFVEVKDTINDAENFLCSGDVLNVMRGNQNADETKAYYGSTELTYRHCNGTSVGRYLSGTYTRMNSSFSAVITFIDNLQAIIGDINDTIASVDNATVYTQLINDTVILLKNDSTLTKGYLTSLYGSGTSNFGGYLPTVAQIPNVTNVDLGIPTYVEQSLTSARASLVETRRTLQPTVEYDLDVKTRNDTNKQWSSVYTDLTEVGNQVLDQIETLVKADKTVSDTKTTVMESEDWGKYITAAIYGCILLCIIIMIIGYVCKKRWPMCCGAYTIFIIFTWMALILGVFLLQSMIVYDACGCDGNYSSEGCTTMMEFIKTNLDGTNYTINGASGEFDRVIERLLLCPAPRNTSTGEYIYSNSTNFVDIMGIEEAFNYTKEIQEPIDELNDAKTKLNASSVINDAINATVYAKLAMARINIGVGYNFTDDQSQYVFLKSELSGPNANSYYTGGPNAGENSANIVLLDRLIVLNPQFGVRRTELRVRQKIFNTTMDQIVTDCISINDTVNQAYVDIDNSTAELHQLTEFIMSANRFTPCGWLSEAYSDLVVSTTCEDYYEVLNDTIPGAIMVMISVLCGFFLLVMMRQCVVFHVEEQSEVSTVHEGETADSKNNPKPASGEVIGNEGDMRRHTPKATPQAVNEEPRLYPQLAKSPIRRNTNLPAPIGEVAADGSAPI